ncbi:MAG: flagellar basal-body MS-ring/collar protein FliF [Tepidiformaceae bacterium]
MGPGSPLNQIMERWNQLPRARQMALAGIVAGTIVVAYFMFIASSSPNLVLAFTGLAPEDSAAIADQLTKDGVPYELGGGGSTISLPANKVAETRIKLAQVGLPKGGSVGLEIFDKQNFGATDFVQQVNYQRAIEGELARSINTLDGVKASRVSIVMPKEAIFSEDQAPATASVLLSLKPGADLNQDQIKGITNLVSNSVENLKAAGVTIIDQTGHVLFDGALQDGQFSTGATGTQLDMQHSYELQLQRDLDSTLTKIVGAGRSATTVRAKLNFDKVQTADEKYGNTTPLSSTTHSETFAGTGVNVGAVPGTGTNGSTTSPGTSTTANGNSNYTTTDTTTNNQVDKTTTSVIKAPGTVDKLSVSVVLDESVTAAQQASITGAVAASVGLDQTRGDTLSVTRLPFDASAKDDLVAAAGNGLGQYLSYLKLLLPLLAVVLAFVLVMLLLRSLSKRQLALPAPYQMQALPAGAMSMANAIAAPMALDALQPAGDPQEDRVMKLAEVNPRAVADVVQTWMREEEQ